MAGFRQQKTEHQKTQTKSTSLGSNPEENYLLDFKNLKFNRSSDFTAHSFLPQHPFLPCAHHSYFHGQSSPDSGTDPAPGSQLWLQPWVSLSGVSHEAVVPSGEAEAITALDVPELSSPWAFSCWSCAGQAMLHSPSPTGDLCWAFPPAPILAKSSLSKEITALWQYENTFNSTDSPGKGEYTTKCQ